MFFRIWNGFLFACWGICQLILSFLGLILFCIAYFFEYIFGISEETIQDTILISLQYEPYSKAILKQQVENHFCFTKVDSTEFDLLLTDLVLREMVDKIRQPDGEFLYQLSVKGRNLHLLAQQA